MSVPTKLHFDFDVPVGQNIDAYVTVTYGDFTIRGFMVVMPPSGAPYVLPPRRRLQDPETGETRFETVVTVDEEFGRRQAFDTHVLYHWREAKAKRWARADQAGATS